METKIFILIMICFMVGLNYCINQSNKYVKDEFKNKYFKSFILDSDKYEDKEGLKYRNLVLLLIVSWIIFGIVVVTWDDLIS